MTKQAQKEARDAKRADALRENLKRRKAQGQERAAAPTDKTKQEK